jgi:hypothetical protein
MIGTGNFQPTIEGDLLKADIIGYISSHALADKPVLEEE